MWNSGYGTSQSKYQFREWYTGSFCDSIMILFSPPLFNISLELPSSLLFYLFQSAFPLIVKSWDNLLNKKQSKLLEFQVNNELSYDNMEFRSNLMRGNLGY